LARYDRDADYKISKAEFINEIIALSGPSEEGDENEDNEAYESNEQY
jgi:hypothetical protein